MGVSDNHEIFSEAIKASPPVTVVSMALGGITLQDWVLIATLIYTLMQAGWFIYSKFFRKTPTE
jgi:hypothetical protein